MPELKLGTRYRVVTEIASGGMGTVVLALKQDGESWRPVAVKQLHSHLVDDPDVVAGFVDEARIASRLKHPNVVHVRDVEMIGDALVIVMDYVEGIPLSALLRYLKERGEELPVNVVRRIVTDALRGLHAAHELRDENGKLLSVVHRDVSPHNLLVGADGITRVTDFGVAMASGRVATTHADRGVKGKLQYLSPEQIYRRPLDRRADVFSAGIVTWEALAGRRLFGAATEGETLAMVLREPIAPPSTHRVDVPLDLDETCLKALERDPSRRFETAEAFAAALEQGPVAKPEEVAAIVVRALGETLTERRAQLAQALARKPEADPEPAVLTASSPPRRRRTTFFGRRPRPIVAASLVLAGSILGGIVVWLVVRTPQAAPPVIVTIPPAEPEAQPPISISAAEEPLIELTDPPPPPAPIPTQTTASTGSPSRPKVVPKVRRSQDGGRRPFIPDDL